MNRFIAAFLLVAFVMFSSAALAAEKATPEDVYTMVMKAYTVLDTLGSDGLEAFNDPKGDFVFKDSYVYVLQCPGTMAAHPFALEQLKGRDLDKETPFQRTLCAGAKDPNGSWVEYEWPKPGETDPSRKISFIISVAGTPYQVAAGIYNDDISLEELQGTSN